MIETENKVILPGVLYDKAKALGVDTKNYVRSENLMTAAQSKKRSVQEIYYASNRKYRRMMIAAGRKNAKRGGNVEQVTI